MAKHLFAFTEKLNFSISPLVLLFSAGVCLLVTYNAQARCWTPAAFTDPMTEYSLIGIDINALSSMADVESTDPAHRKKPTESISAYLHSHLTNRRASVILTCCYIFTLSLCLLNAALQFFVLEHNIFDRKFYPLSVAAALRNNQPMPESKTFPRVVLCDLEVRLLGNVHRHTVQCSIQTNDLLEKIFLFVWFWILFCLIWNVGAMIYWTFVSLFSFLRVKFIEGHLFGGHLEASVSKDALWDFSVNFIGVDGTFCLRLLEDACGYFVVSEIIRSLLDKQVRQKYGSNRKYTQLSNPIAEKANHRYYPVNAEFTENLAKEFFTIERKPINNLDTESRHLDTDMHTDANKDFTPEKLYKPLVFDAASPSAPEEDD
uniref:Innexin n=1 Tax=Romanomermis culicivorax TaxID=13658 RepID=A0A915ISJ5_ROMCU